MMIVFDEYTGLYFYSAVFQGNMALLALVAVFVVFKLQALTNSLQTKEDQIFSFVTQFCVQKGMELDFLREMLRNLDTFHERFRAKLSDDYRPSNKPSLVQLCDSPHLGNYLADRKHILGSKAELISKMKPPFIAVAVVICVSLILLPIAYNLHIKCPSWEIYLIAGTVLCNVVALIMNVLFVFRVLKQ